ncbi:19692_t:CDS:2 [Racocetra fulgida]|uniref:19692_t:CDS:1 n=1 Tax=Racocetra fulgida TaxID=60492 RepID=A0A9N9B245_9GLOM|nr:19692_t:CDS:2 [Racocetra fulgida]
MSSHDIVEVREPPESNHDNSLWHNPLFPIYSSLKERTKYIKKNVSISELSGSLGDLGTLLPILVSLSINGQISLTSSLIFGGLWNIISGLMFRIPMCVQPMKAIAAVALSAHLTIGEVMSAGIGVGAMIFILGITRTIRLVGKWTPISIIRGIQLGAGITLIIKSADLVRQRGSWGGSSWQWSDNYEWAILAFIFVFIFYSSRRIPTALILFIFGLIVAIIKVSVSNDKSKLPSISFNYPDVIVIPTLEEFKNGFLTASLGQLPLTALNSVIALAALAEDLFPKWTHVVTVEKISVSIGFMNIIGCFFGSIPYCHGSGGLAAELSAAARNFSNTDNDGSKKEVNDTKKKDDETKNGTKKEDDETKNDTKKEDDETKKRDDEIKKRDFTLMIITAGLLVGFQNDAIGYIGGMLVSFLFFIASFVNRKYYQSPTTHTIV